MAKWLAQEVDGVDTRCVDKDGYVCMPPALYFLNVPSPLMVFL